MARTPVRVRTRSRALLGHAVRSRSPLYYAAIAGVPHQLLQAQPGDFECPSGTNPADCPQKERLSPSDWQAITGADPEHYDFSGMDPHMLESEQPRAGLPCSPTASDNCDPISGREWTTNKKDLQFACTFDLVDPNDGNPTPKNCALPQFTGACDCAVGSNSQNTPLCQRVNGAYTNMQIKGKAYPSVRAMEIAHQMADSRAGVQGIVTSLCPIHTTFRGGTTDPLYGYRPAVNAIVNRLKTSLLVQCLPQRLSVDPMRRAVPCQILVTLPKPGDESICSAGSVPGIAPVDPALLVSFRASQESAWQQKGGTNSGLPDPNTLPVCTLQQLTPQANPVDFDVSGSCVSAVDSGWCYVEGVAAGACPQQIVFTAGEPPLNSVSTIQCSY